MKFFRPIHLLCDYPIYEPPYTDSSLFERGNFCGDSANPPLQKIGCRPCKWNPEFPPTFSTDCWMPLPYRLRPASAMPHAVSQLRGFTTNNERVASLWICRLMYAVHDRARRRPAKQNDRLTPAATSPIRKCRRRLPRTHGRFTATGVFLVFWWAIGDRWRIFRRKSHRAVSSMKCTRPESLLMFMIMFIGILCRCARWFISKWLRNGNGVRRRAGLKNSDIDTF